MSSAAQRVYMLLLSQPNLTHAGTIPLTVRRWASKAPDTSEQDMIAALRECEQHRFILIDGKTEELLVRTLIRNDNVYRQPKVFKAAKAEAELLSSRKLRRALVAELRALSITSDETVADRNALVESLSDSEPDPPDTPPDTPGEGSPIPNGKAPRSAGGGSPTPAPSPSHSPPVPAFAAPDASLHERASAIANGYHQAVKGMCKWPAVCAIVKKAIKTESWTDQAILDAVLRLAGDNRSVTFDSLRIELDGIRPRAPASNPLHEKRRNGLAVIHNLRNEPRGEIA
jgi:hypothetical protein